MISLRSVLTPHNLTSLRALESVTQIPDNSVKRQAARVLILEYHPRVGGLSGFIGIPMGDIQPLDNGYMRPYSGGNIKFLDNASTSPQATHIHEAEVRFVGFRCHEQSEGGPDEPYFIISVSGANAELNVTKTFGTYENVTAGHSYYSEQLIISNAQPPFTISVTAMDRDLGDADAAAEKIKNSMKDATDKLTLALLALGVNPAIGGIIQGFISIFAGTIGDIFSALTGSGDDLIGTNSEVLFDWDADKTIWKNPRQLTSEGVDKPYNKELVLDNGEGGRYSAYFQVNFFTVDRTVAPHDT
jgi:hypothetical protein